MEPITILLVEDEMLLLIEFEAALTESGLDVLACSKGAEAVASLRSEESAVGGVITDIRLQDRAPDGWEVGRVAREIDLDMPVVYISGDSAADWHSKAFRTASCLQSRSRCRD